MKKFKSFIPGGVILLSLIAILLTSIDAEADSTLDEWTPIFKGIDRTTGRMTPVGGDTKLMVVQILRIDLTDPDVQIFTTPRATNYQARVRETVGQSVSSFLQANQLQVAVNANFYDPTDPALPGQSAVIKGLHISRGVTVSSQDSSAEDFAVLFTTNNQIRYAFNNYPPTNTARIYNAISGRYALISHGVSVANNNTSPISGDQPRTSVGSSKDGRYLFLMVIDGRQPGWSDGAEDEDTAAWLLSVGAYNAVMMDGGGSTTMVRDCLGGAVELNRPSNLFTAVHRERYVASHIGVHAKPLAGFIENVGVRKSITTATLTWTTRSNAAGFVEYGTDLLYRSQTPLEATPTLNHSVRLGGLTLGTTVYFRIHATDRNGQDYLMSSCFVPDAVLTPIFPFTQVWKYETNNLDGVQWVSKNYVDTQWLGQGRGLLYVEDNVNVTPKNTALPIFSGAGTSTPKIPITYYFRTHFSFTNRTAGVSLLFSNYIDDGAVFYLNGTEIQRVRMADAPATIANTDLAVRSNPASPCSGDAISTCPTVFWIEPDSLSALVKGDNVLAVEVHNYNAGSSDVVFGVDLKYSSGAEAIAQAPKITTNPASKDVIAGAAASFTVAASGTDPLSYSWFFNGVAIAGATASSFTIPSVSASDVGSYSVSVSNAGGSVVSEAATLALLSVTAPILTVELLDGKFVIRWRDGGFTLQQTTDLESDPIPWADVPGPVIGNSYLSLPEGSRRFFRLRN